MLPTHFERSTSWFTLTDNCDSCDLLFVSAGKGSRWSLLRRWGGGVVGNPFFGLTSGGVGGGVKRLVTGDAKAKGEDGVESLESGGGDGGDRVVSTGGKEEVEGRGWWVNRGELPMFGEKDAADLL
jgi:hypothetical protein